MKQKKIDLVKGRGIEGFKPECGIKLTCPKTAFNLNMETGNGIRNLKTVSIYIQIPGNIRSWFDRPNPIPVLIKNIVEKIRRKVKLFTVHHERKINLLKATNYVALSPSLSCMTIDTVKMC